MYSTAIKLFINVKQQKIFRRTCSQIFTALLTTFQFSVHHYMFFFRRSFDYLACSLVHILTNFKHVTILDHELSEFVTFVNLADN